MSAFTKAVKGQTTAKIALTGPSGSGKTYSALLLAQGLGGRVAVIDSENHSASLYADKWSGFEYDVAPIDPPYTGDKYFKLIAEAIRNYDVIIIDSASHLWAGEGGLLEQKSAMDSRGGNGFTNWGAITKIHEKFKSLIVNAPVHVIVTMRSKQEYIIDTNERGKQVPKKVGLAPVQRDGMEYEFTCVLDIGEDHQFKASKDRTDLFKEVIATIEPKHGEMIRAWLAGGSGSTTEEVREKFLKEWEQHGTPEQRPPVSNAVKNMGKPNQQRQVVNHAPGANGKPPQSAYVTMAHVNRLSEMSTKLEIKPSEMKQIIGEFFNKESSLQLTEEEYEMLVWTLEAKTKAEVMVRLAEINRPQTNTNGGKYDTE